MRVRKENAEKVRVFLSGSGNLDKGHAVLRRGPFVYFPLEEKPDDKAMRELRGLGAGLSKANFAPQKGKMNYGELMAKARGSSPEDSARGYDLLGDIAVIDASPAAARRMAGALMKANGNIKTVLRKGGAVSGRFRTRKFYYVAGRRNYLADYRENGCRFRFDVRKVFFSPRLAHERNRVSGLARDGESVVVMFSGVGPFAIEIAKAHRNCKVVAMELNKEAHKAAIKNKELNKVGNVALAQGDVKKLASEYRGFTDRIVMPLPKDAARFLDEVLTVAKPKCTVHYYAFCKSGGESRTIEGIRKFFESHGKRFKLIAMREVRPYSHDMVEIVVDFAIHDKKI